MKKLSQMLLFVFIGMLFFSFGCSKRNDNNDIENYDKLGPYDVVRIVDGDTIILEIDGNEERVRLIGIDTPESDTAEGDIATAYAVSLLSEQSVWIELDIGQRDRYERILAYVYLSSGEMVNEILLREGYAQTMTIQPNVKYVERFYDIQQKARVNEVGFWEKHQTIFDK